MCVGGGGGGGGEEGGEEAGRGEGRPMSCAAPGPALALDATVSYCCWVRLH